MSLKNTYGIENQASSQKNEACDHHIFLMRGGGAGDIQYTAQKAADARKGASGVPKK